MPRANRNTAQDSAEPTADDPTVADDSPQVCADCAERGEVEACEPCVEQSFCTHCGPVCYGRLAGVPCEEVFHVSHQDGRHVVVTVDARVITVESTV